MEAVKIACPTQKCEHLDFNGLLCQRLVCTEKEYTEDSRVRLYLIVVNAVVLIKAYEGRLCWRGEERDRGWHSPLSPPATLLNSRPGFLPLPTTEVWLVICKNPRDMTSSVDLCVFFKNTICLLYVLFS